MDKVKAEIIGKYIDQLYDAIDEWSEMDKGEFDCYDLVREIIAVMEEDVPSLAEKLKWTEENEYTDVKIIIGSLRMYLADNGVEYIEKHNQDKDMKLKRFWYSFWFWFEKELPCTELLKDEYREYDSSIYGEEWYLIIDFDYEYRLNLGIDFPNSLKNNTCGFEEIKDFIELAYRKWIKSEMEFHYEFTVEVNNRLRMFKLPFRLQNGRVVKQGYKTSYSIDRIINNKMFERKIRFSEDMIIGKDLMEKKSALDFIIDALQYLISIEEGENVDKKHASLSKSVNEDESSMVYSVIKRELDELMRISNDCFDIRHNEYLNKAKKPREVLNDSQFVEYLYNRAYSLLYLLRLKSGR